MAKVTAAWGIDIGQCALKALRCVPDATGEKLVAEAFDYIEYPKILSQPDAEPEVLIREALQQFLSRNELKGDKVAISVSGQSGLSRFFRPPPVTVKTLPELVKYEAQQQIPFPLQDVIWDYQLMGGQVVDGMTIEAEAGIFAMKREAVFKALQPFTDAEVEIDIIQLAPLTVYNVVLKEIIKNLPDPAEFDPTNPPESWIVLSLGTDTTDLVITDGIHMWMRNIPIGGNHFTKQLARELKLTYAKAEHLKRTARQAEDAKTVFQAMRPVFNDLVTEIQRSLSYFQGNNKKAKLGHMVMLGNAAKLPGLRQYLTQQLGNEISKISSFAGLTGSAVSSKQFEENVLSYANCYGLCLQALGKAQLKTNLLPPEFITERMIRAKKPWALASVGALLLTFSIYTIEQYVPLWNVNPKNVVEGVSWEQASTEAKNVQTTIENFKTQDSAKVQELEKVRQIQAELAGQTDGRRLWPEMLQAINQLLPRDPRIPPGTNPDPKVVPFEGRQGINLDYVESKYFADFKEWLTEDVKRVYAAQLNDKLQNQLLLEQAAEAEAAAAQPAVEGEKNGDAEKKQAAAKKKTPQDIAAEVDKLKKEMQLKGGGWVIEIGGHHFFNHAAARDNGTAWGTYVRQTIMRHFEEQDIVLPIVNPATNQTEMMTFKFKDLGTFYPVMIELPKEESELLANSVPNMDHPAYKKALAAAASGTGGGGPRSGLQGASTGGGAGAGESAAIGVDSGGSTPKGGNPMGSTPGTGAAATEEEEVTNEPLSFPAPKYVFVVQFAWQPVKMKERVEQKLREQAEAAKKAKQAGGAGANPAAGNTTPAAGNGTPAATPSGAAPGTTTPATPTATPTDNTTPPPANGGAAAPMGAVPAAPADGSNPANPTPPADGATPMPMPMPPAEGAGGAAPTVPPAETPAAGTTPPATPPAADPAAPGGAPAVPPASPPGNG